MRLARYLATALTLAGTAWLGIAPPTAASTTSPMTTKERAVKQLRTEVNHNRQSTWHYQDAAGITRTRTVYAERHTTSTPFLHWIRRLWRLRRDTAKRLVARASPAGGIGHYALWMCIHRGEGAWNANTGNGYLGGLQMTPGWGGVARPDLLAPAQQMALAERGYRASGYSTVWLEGQWPNTSPPCLGLA